YSVKFSTLDFAKRGRVEGNVRDRIWYALHRHGIALPIPKRSVVTRRTSRRQALHRQEERVARQERSLRCVDFFRCLNEEACHKLAALAETRLYAEDEVILKQGDPGDDLFILERGEVLISAEENGKPSMELTRMGPPAFFGEMSLLTGEPR